MRKPLLLGLLAVVPAVADVAGNWKVEGSIGQFTVDLVCSLKESGNKLTGNCKGGDIGDVALTGETQGSNVKWSYKVDFQGQSITVVYAGTLDSPAAMKGNITVMDSPSGTFTAQKQ